MEGCVKPEEVATASQEHDVPEIEGPFCLLQEYYAWVMCGIGQRADYSRLSNI